jgi:Domain of unknown function (DUF4389)
MDPSAYPVQYSVDYPDRNLDRGTTFFRLFTIIPIWIVFASVTGVSSYYDFGGQGAFRTVGTGGVLAVAPGLMILFRRKYPRWWFDWNLEVMRFGNRVTVYLFLMDDNYPSTDERQSVHLDFGYPDVVRDLTPWMPLVKWFLAIPHYVVLLFLWIGAFFVVIAAWFAIMFTGRYPRSLFNYVEGVVRWSNRVVAYAFAMVTDTYPPFRLEP